VKGLCLAQPLLALERAGDVCPGAVKEVGQGVGGVYALEEEGITTYVCVSVGE